MQLSKRLRAVADFVTPQGRLADVGTDHAYVPICLMEEKKISGAVAMDIVDGPLQRARENIAAHHLETQIETRKSDGLEALRPGEVDTIVIAGMGGLLICRILEQGREVAATVPEWVLEPQSDTDKVRAYLLEQGYHICDEDMVLEDGKYYPVLQVRAGREQTPYEPVELIYGRHLLRKRHPVLRLIWKRRSFIPETAGKSCAVIRRACPGERKANQRDFKAGRAGASDREPSVW